MDSPALPADSRPVAVTQAAEYRSWANEGQDGTASPSQPDASASRSISGPISPSALAPTLVSLQEIIKQSGASLGDLSYSSAETTKAASLGSVPGRRNAISIPRLEPSADHVAKRRKTDMDEVQTWKRPPDILELQASCNSHEKLLLGGIVSPDSLRTSYDDVCVHHSAKVSLQGLTLAMQHPEEFTYGVLDNSNLTGVLLYGPPGTGKTMLVKAFARESGATVLEISAADVLNSYVGESEKTVCAIFSLAHKLKPCVVFIDEADGILGRRNTHDMRYSRTLTNQFLREWDGLSSGEGGDRGVVLVAATNRPFDMDDAVLRRLPQRIFIDMPEAEARTRILGIHLQGEALGPCASVVDLARSTPFYSGSDLKNLVVAAAMHCVRERVAAKQARHRGEADKLGARRTIKMAHLLRARNEIRPATSEETLQALRAFHTKYGSPAMQG